MLHSFSFNSCSAVEAPDLHSKLPEFEASGRCVAYREATVVDFGMPTAVVWNREEHRLVLRCMEVF